MSATARWPVAPSPGHHPPGRFKDRAHLALLQAAVGLGSLGRITGSDVYKLVICRKAVYDDLRRLGGTERKSLTLAWPEVPAAQLAHFVRGYVDGDGCLSWNRPNNSVIPSLDAVGTQQFLLGMAASIEAATGIPSPRCHANSGDNAFRVAWYGITAKCLAIWLYHQHSGLALERKARLADDFAAGSRGCSAGVV